MTAPTKTSQVHVGVRVRPLTSQEVSQGGKRVVDACSPTVGIGERRFTYDSVFDSHVTQSDLYNTISPPLLGSFLDGYNATIMAYGQTGSGKTFTMGSEAHSEGESVVQPGLIPRFMSDVFEMLQRKKMESDSCPADEKNKQVLLEYHVTASFLEVYGEDVHDLLDEDRKTLPIREDSEGGVICVGLKNKPVSNASEALNVLHLGTLNRTTAATLMNLTSSRSHAVFTIRLEQVIRTSSAGGADVDVTTRSCFTFVDLAGSERMKKTGAEGERAREGIKINEGLLALGNVINALADEERLAKEKKIHVPYRQSKLTRLLQDALGGNSQTLFLACVSPSDTNASETLSTLHYANRARNIKNAPTKNVDGTVLELQRLNALNFVLQCELVKERFTDSSGPSTEETKEEQKIGHASEDLWNRKDVQEYIQLLHRAAAEQGGGFPVAPLVSSAPPVSSGLSTNQASLPLSSAPLQLHGDNDAAILDTALTKFDDAMLEEVNPDEEMAILDQLLDLQHQDKEFNKEQKKDDEELKQVEGELVEQEAMLLQLRESLKVYHNMKAQYEVLMTEVQNLEKEKSNLADQLEKATADPSKGCSQAIKKKLEKVEHSLARARTETRKHQQMYRKAEQEAQKCKAMERKIADLKHGKVALLKKQRAAAARHREYTESKTREIMALRKKERNAGNKVSKMETEIRIHKANLEKRKAYCNKLTQKLKQTESHLMKLLTMRKRDLHDPRRRTSIIGSTTSKPLHGGKEDTSFAPKTEEITSMKFLLEKMISDHVGSHQMKLRYEERVVEYTDLMRKLVEEMKELKEARGQLSNSEGGDPELEGVVRDHERNVEELELKQELVSTDLEDLRSKLPDLEEMQKQGEGFQETAKSKESAMKMISNLHAPVIRTLLWEIMDKLATSELLLEDQKISIARKESALESFKSEIESKNAMITALSSDVAQRRRISLSGEDPLDTIQRLREEISSLNADLVTAVEEKEMATNKMSGVQNMLRKKEREHAVTRERLTMLETVHNKSEKHEAEAILEKTQQLWNELGVSPDDRESQRSQIKTCLLDLCKSQLTEAIYQKARTRQELKSLNIQFLAMHEALGLPLPADSFDEQNLADMTLLEKLDSVEKKVDSVLPVVGNAVERRANIIRDVESLYRNMGFQENQLSTRLKTLLQQYHAFVDTHSARVATPAKRLRELVSSTPAAVVGRQHRVAAMKEVQDMVNALDGRTQTDEETTPFDVNENSPSRDPEFGPPGSLSDEFLEQCERDVKELRLSKSETLAQNTEMRATCEGLSKDMNLSGGDVLSMAVHSIKKRQKELPRWWSNDCAREVSKTITSVDGVVGATKEFTDHLALIHEALSGISVARRTLSKELHAVVERTRKILLKAMEGKDDASEATSFHDALFRLPPLSKEHIHACIDEMNTLVAGVEGVTQSELETLTVVWEALSVSAGDRGHFWGRIEESTAAVQTNAASPFDVILQSRALDSEAWVLSAVKKATRSYRQLNVKLHKLELIHQEVEKMRSKQDSKSKIVSLDSEIRILNAKLADFEEKKCSKQRLLTKKTNSSALLKEERFRKHMQGKFTSKLEQLGNLLQNWNAEEGTELDSRILSDEVGLLLENSDNMTTWVEKRTAFMHLRTVQAKGSENKTPLSRKDRSKTSDLSTPRRKRALPSDSPLRQRNGDSTRKARTAASPTPRKRRMPPAVSSVRAKAAKPREGIQKKRLHPIDRSKSPAKTKNRRKADESASGMTPLSLNVSPAGNSALTKDAKKTSRSTLLPFGHLLSEATSPKNKENEMR